MDANSWLRSFFQEFKENASVRRSYEKYKARQRSPDVEWTHIMAVFLAHLAKRMGYFQEWEIGTDFTWHRGADSVPVVSIEHENTPEVKNEIINLLPQASKLKVLITYTPVGLADGIAQHVKEQLTKVGEESRRNVGEFLLLVGDDEDRGPIHWEAFIFKWGNEYRELRCHELKNIKTDFYEGIFSELKV